MRYVFTGEEIAEIQEIRRKNRDKNVERRLKALELKATGCTGQEIAKQTDYNPGYISRLAAKYRKGGIEAITGNHYGGNHRNMTYEEEAEVLEKYIHATDGGHITDVSAIKSVYDEKIGHQTGHACIERGVTSFDSFKFDALQKAAGGQLVTNQIEWNPLCFEHFESGMMDYLTVNRIRPTLWSPLAGGRLFDENDALAQKAMAKIREIAQRHGVEPAVIAFAWLMYHPVGAMPISGSNKLSRLVLAIQALDVKLEHWEWYEIYTASGQKVLR